MEQSNPDSPYYVMIVPAYQSSKAAVAEQTDNIVHWTQLDRGGHFASLEAPDLVLGELRAMFRDYR